MYVGIYDIFFFFLTERQRSTAKTRILFSFSSGTVNRTQNLKTHKAQGAREVRTAVGLEALGNDHSRLGSPALNSQSCTGETLGFFFSFSLLL